MLPVVATQTLLKLLGFELRDEDSVLVLDTPKVVVANLTKTRDQLRHELDKPQTDVAARLQQVTAGAPKPWGPCLAFYAAQELLQVISAMRLTSNTITRRIVLSPGLKVRAHRVHLCCDPSAAAAEPI